MYISSIRWQTKYGKHRSKFFCRQWNFPLANWICSNCRGYKVTRNPGPPAFLEPQFDKEKQFLDLLFQFSIVNSNKTIILKFNSKKLIKIDIFKEGKSFCWVVRKLYHMGGGGNKIIGCFTNDHKHAHNILYIPVFILQEPINLNY